MTDSNRQHAAGRRRLDRVVDPSYLEDLDQRDAAELRAMRNDCQAEEARLSYQRRLLQGKLDIARAEAARRGAGESLGLIEALPRILADAPTGDGRGARATALYHPPESRRVDDDVLAGDLGRMPDLDDEQLVAMIGELALAERDVSTLRTQVLERVDRLQAELVARYRVGGIALDDILAEPDAQSGSRAGP